MKNIIVLLSSLFLLLLGSYQLFAQTDAEKNAANQMAQRNYKDAEKQFLQIIIADPNSVIANYGLAKVKLQEQQELKQKEANNIRYANMWVYFDLLKQAYAYAEKASQQYAKTQAEKRDAIRKVINDTDEGIRTQLMQIVSNEAFNLLTAAPYRKPTALLYQTQVYDRNKDAEVLDELRSNLLAQCNEYLTFYPKSANHYKVEQYRKELLQEYITKESLRQFGDKSGRNYEKYCDLVLTHFDEKELEHIVYEFYGAEYGYGRTAIQEKEEYKKLNALAQANKMTILTFLCKLNLHDKGCTPENKTLYDQLIKKLAPADIAYIAVQKVATPLINAKDYTGAANVFKSYAALFPKDRRKFEKIVEILLNQNDSRTVVNLGANINSPQKDYNPVISLDGNTLYFTRKNADTGEDIYVSQKKNGQWTKAVLLGYGVNTNSHEVPLSITADGKTLVIYGNYAKLSQFSHLLSRESRLGKGDIYFSEKQPDGSWGAIDVFTFPINSVNYETGLSFTADKKAVLFCSDRKGAVGGYNPNYHPDYLYFHGAGEFNLDLYVSVKEGDKWSEPINLGTTINTPFAEKNPFLHPDMKTLYFSSDGHPGLGGYDIYMSKRLDNTWTNWSEPVNLGKVINSPYDDVFYIDGTGINALIVSNKEGKSFGDLDIYMVEMPEKFRPQPSVFVSGIVTDNNNMPIKTDIYWEEQGNAKVNGRVANDPKDGSFTMVLPVGKKYVYYADTDPYFSGSIELDITTQKAGSTVVAEKLTAISFNKNDKTHQAFVMRNLEFDHNSDVIRPESFYDLNRMVFFLKKHPELKIAIEGHTDSNGDDAFNEDLSKRRCESVKKYLTEKGISPTKLVAQGFGEKKPIATNATEEGRQLNRRVEFKVID